MAALTLAHPESLSPRAQELLPRLAARPWAEEFYLAGSAALALYTGHRPVRDLDLMSNTNRLDQPGPARPPRRAAGGRSRRPRSRPPATATLRPPRRAAPWALRFFYYPYPLVEPFEEISAAWRSPRRSTSA